MYISIYIYIYVYTPRDPPPTTTTSTSPTHSAQQEHKRQLEALQAELQARTEAFDLYRARSHTTLKKVAAGQRGAEDRVAGVQVRGLLKVVGGWGCGGVGGDDMGMAG